MKEFFFILAVSLLLFSCKRSTQQSASEAGSAIIIDSLNPEVQHIIASEIKKIQENIQSPIPIMRLRNADAFQKEAEEIAMASKEFLKRVFEIPSHKAYRNEIFNVYPARPQEIPQEFSSSKMYRVEMYNYALNFTTVALVNLDTKKIISISEMADTQPDIPPYLNDLAVQIAIHHPQVIAALGYKPGEEQALMSNTKTALNHTKCERSEHLCVAPTFTIKDKALWVIVDLSEFKVVGIRWTQTGKENETPTRISEKKLKFDKIMDCYCKQMNSVEKNNWKFNYIITSSDGLRISDVFYKNNLVLHNAKIVDWHVSYSNTDGFGYSDAVGCPEFSQAAVVAVSDPKIAVLEKDGKSIGFVLEQYFSSEQWPEPCNYNYLQRFEFYNDGKFRVAGASLGRGCGNNGTYRPVFRIALAGEENNFYYHENNTWQYWKNEQWKLQTEQDQYTEQGFLYKIANKNNHGFYIEPNRGQFNDNSRGDHAYIYVTKHHKDKDEGDNDLVSIGPCCNSDYKQGPEKFIEPKADNIENSRLIIWYVPQIKNDNSPGKEYCWAESYLENGVYKTRVFPCMVGPLFSPF